MSFHNLISILFFDARNQPKGPPFIIRVPGAHGQVRGFLESDGHPRSVPGQTLTARLLALRKIFPLTILYQQWLGDKVIWNKVRYVSDICIHRLIITRDD